LQVYKTTSFFLDCPLAQPRCLVVFGGGWTHLGAAHSHFGPQLCMSKQRPKVWLGIIHGAEAKQGRQ